MRNFLLFSFQDLPREVAQRKQRILECKSSLEELLPTPKASESRTDAQEVYNRLLEIDLGLEELNQRDIPDSVALLRWKMDLFNRLEAFCDFCDNATQRERQWDTVRVTQVSY